MPLCHNHHRRNRQEDGQHASKNCRHQTCYFDLCEKLKDCRKKFEKKLKIFNCFRRPKNHDLLSTSTSSSTPIPPQETPSITDLPNELLEKIFSYTEPTDILSLERTCSTFRSICLKNRQRLPKIPIQYANCQYGKWFDVLKKHPCKKDYVEVEYTLSEPVLNRSKNLARQKSYKPISFDLIARECKFDFLTVDVELLNADFRKLMHFDELKVDTLILNFSHPKLFPRIMDRYLPGICYDLSQNRHVKNVDFIFCQKPENEPYKEKLKHLMKRSCYVPKKILRVYLLDVYKIEVDKPKNKFI